MTVLEAMSCGVPVVLRDLELYQNILSGVYRSGRDVEGFERVLRRLQQEPDFYQESVQRSLEGSRFYNRERIAQMWRAFYGQVLAGKRDTHAPVLRPEARQASRKRMKLPAGLWTLR